MVSLAKYFSAENIVKVSENGKPSTSTMTMHQYPARWVIGNIADASLTQALLDTSEVKTVELKWKPPAQEKKAPLAALLELVMDSDKENDADAADDPDESESDPEDRVVVDEEPFGDGPPSPYAPPPRVPFDGPFAKLSDGGKDERDRYHK